MDIAANMPVLTINLVEYALSLEKKRTKINANNIINAMIPNTIPAIAHLLIKNKKILFQDQKSFVFFIPDLTVAT